jgi:hypothetical protein
MKKLNQEQQTKVETARAAVIKLQEAQEIIYSDLTKEIGWDLDFKCKAWSKLKNAANKLNIAAIRSIVGFNCDITFSTYAGCSTCPCSPGFRVRKCVGGNHRVNCDVWMNIEVDASELVAMLPKYTEMLKKEIELNSELVPA